MSLVNAERRRLFKRRSTRLMLLIAVLIFGGVVTGFTVASHRNDADARATAVQRANEEYERQLGFHRQFVAQCKADKAAGVPQVKEMPEDCFESMGPTPDSFNPEWYMPYQFNFRTDFPTMISLFAGVMVLIAFVIGASYVGAEWNSGGMMNLLIWRPRRIPVLLTKLGTLVGGVLASGLVLAAAWTGAFWLIGKYDGTLGKLTAGAWRSFGLSGARALALALAFAVAGFALASLGRHTAMALGVAIGVALGSEVGLRIALEIIRVPFSSRYFLSTYAAAWMEKTLTFENWRACEFAMGQCQPQKLTITWQHSAWLFGIATLLLAGAALWAIRRRDVT